MKIKVNTFMQYKDCECGGIFAIPANGFVYSTYPQQRDFKCTKCGKLVCLSEHDWPRFVYEEVVEEDINKK